MRNTWRCICGGSINDRVLDVYWESRREVMHYGGLSEPCLNLFNLKLL